MKTAPAGFVRMLTILDPLLSVRFGETIGCWVIERKAHVPASELEFLQKRKARTERLVRNPPSDARPSVLTKNRNMYMGVSEELIAAKTGKRVVLFAEDLNQQLYDRLCAADISRYGGYARFADELEAQESRKAADGERVLANRQHALNCEAYDMLNFIWKKKEDMLLNGERNMGKLLHGKKCTGPLVELTDF